MSLLKRKRTSLSIRDKLRVLEKLESGTPVSKICEEFDIAKQTVSDIKKKKDSLLKFVLKYNVDSSGLGKSIIDRKNIKVARDANLEDEIFKWYLQEKGNGTVVRGFELQAAAERLAKCMHVANFSASNGWLWRFRKRHNIGYTNDNCSDSKTKPMEHLQDSSSLWSYEFKQTDSKNDEQGINNIPYSSCDNQSSNEAEQTNENRIFIKEETDSGDDNCNNQEPNVIQTEQILNGSLATTTAFSTNRDSSETDADKHFLLSLLPHLNALTIQEKLKFQIRTLNVINEIINDRESVGSDNLC